MRDIINADHEFHAVTWKEHFERHAATKFTMEVLRDIVETMRIGIFFITNDDQVVIRHKSGYTTRTNVWFEIGMFAAQHGQENAIVLVEESDQAGAKIPTDYYGINFPTFKISTNAKKAILSAWEKKRKLPRRFAEELRTALRKCFRITIRRVLRERLEQPTEFITTIRDRVGCYKKAEDMINDAKERIYTIISYEQELKDQKFDEGLLPFLQHKIENVKRELGRDALGKFDIKRWMNLGVADIQKQAFSILKSRYARNITIRDTYCRFIEAVITEDKVLLPLPRKRHTWVGQGIYIEGRRIADFFAEWFTANLPEPNEWRLTKDNFHLYVEQAQIRNKGHRGHRCHACSTAMPDGKRDAIRRKFPSLGTF